MGVNFRANKVRFPAPVPTVSRIRMHLVQQELEAISGGVQAIMQRTFEREGHDKPVCVAEMASYRFV